MQDELEVWFLCLGPPRVWKLFALTTASRRGRRLQRIRRCHDFDMSRKPVANEYGMQILLSCTEKGIPTTEKHILCRTSFRKERKVH